MNSRLTRTLTLGCFLVGSLFATLNLSSAVNAATVDYSVTWNASRLFTVTSGLSTLNEGSVSILDEKEGAGTIGVGVSQWKVAGSYSNNIAYHQTWTASSSETPNAAIGQQMAYCTITMPVSRTLWYPYAQGWIQASGPPTSSFFPVYLYTYHTTPVANIVELGSFQCDPTKGIEQFKPTFVRQGLKYPCRITVNTGYSVQQLYYSCSNANPTTKMGMGRAIGGGTVTNVSIDKSNFRQGEWLFGDFSTNGVGRGVTLFQTVPVGDPVLAPGYIPTGPNFITADGSYFNTGAAMCVRKDTGSAANCLHASGQYGYTFSQAVGAAIPLSQITRGGAFIPLVWNISGQVCTDADVATCK